MRPPVWLRSSFASEVTRAGPKAIARAVHLCRRRTDPPSSRGRRGSDSGLFGEATGAVGALTLSGGMRVDRWRIRRRSWSNMSSLPMPCFAMSIIRQGRLEANRSGQCRPRCRKRRGGLTSAAYLGWRLPTLNELFRPFRAGADATAANPLLDPERLAGVEAGARYRGPVLSLSATAFANRLQDSIANVTLGQGPGVFPGVGFVAAGGQYRQRQISMRCVFAESNCRVKCTAAR